MSVALTSPEATALTSPEDQAALQAARKANSRPSVPSIPTIKLKNSEKKVLDLDGKPLARGTYFVEDFDGENKTFRDIGANPVVTVLHRVYTYSYYDDDASELVAWTSEIEGFSDMDPTVFLFSKKGGKAGIEFRGTYPSVKKYMREHYSITKGEKQKSLMKFQNLLYVLFEGKVFRMFVSNASAAGIAEGEKAPDFKNPQRLSLQHFIDTTRGAEMDAALLEFDCKLGSRFIEDAEQPYYIMTFENVGPTVTLLEIVPIYRQFIRDLAMMRQWDLERLGGSDAPIVTPDQVAEAFGDDPGPVIDA